MMVGLDIQYKTIKLDIYLIPYEKWAKKGLTDPNVKPKVH